MAEEVRRGAVVHRSRARYDVYVGRPGPWGNPVRLVEDTPQGRRACLVAYCRWLLGRADLLERVGELRGKTLGCWCAPKRCHGDVLARLAVLPDAPARKAALARWLAPYQR
jgi:Domain of unknown function (DUF4326)